MQPGAFAIFISLSFLKLFLILYGMTYLKGSVLSPSGWELGRQVGRVLGDDLPDLVVKEHHPLALPFPLCPSVLALSVSLVWVGPPVLTSLRVSTVFLPPVSPVLCQPCRLRSCSRHARPLRLFALRRKPACAPAATSLALS